MPTCFVTGTSTGLGRGIASVLLSEGWEVFGCSRRGCDLAGIHDLKIDLVDYDKLPGQLNRLLKNVKNLDLVILNAGVLGEIRDLGDTPTEDIKSVMEINLWANKALLDWLLHHGPSVSQLVAISSGASILGNRGWGGYALSKAALNMLIKLYAHEFGDAHLCALAPGIVDTAMMDHLCDEADALTFPALQRLRDARGTSAMPMPEHAAERVISLLGRLRDRPSGSFIDIREFLEPDTFKNLYSPPG